MYIERNNHWLTVSVFFYETTTKPSQMLRQWEPASVHKKSTTRGLSFETMLQKHNARKATHVQTVRVIFTLRLQNKLTIPLTNPELGSLFFCNYSDDIGIGGRGLLINLEIIIKIIIYGRLRVNEPPICYSCTHIRKFSSSVLLHAGRYIYACIYLLCASCAPVLYNLVVYAIAIQPEKH